MKSAYPYLGFGLGLRPTHYHTVIKTKPKVDWFEIITEDYLLPGGNPHYYLTQIRQNYPLVMHGVSLSIGSVDPLNMQYLQQVKQLANQIQPAWISDHFCWTGINGKNIHDLLPIPQTEQAIRHVVQRIRQVQDFLGRQILLENASSYVDYVASEMSEWEFVTRVIEEADCLLLLDVNNVYVSAFNHGFDAKTYIDSLPIARVQQIHMAGHTNCHTHIIDTHDHDIIDAV
ncbi:MAG TPA: DUF692 domain-containing protein, partial [Gammaproteobacteria bacterium]|nr:DUF692 domain-containing protein [Gammaproteobacteria bacterium]